MARISYVNGRYVAHAQARVHIEDRGYQFADGVYEVMAVLEGRPLDRSGHMARLERSLGELRLPLPMSRRALDLVIDELVRRNQVRHGLVYIQITRGCAPRDFPFPAGVRPSLVMTVRRFVGFKSDRLAKTGVRVITIPDIRWSRRDIKSVALLPQVLGKQQAIDAGAFEAWQVDGNGFVTEGCSSNAWIIARDGRLVTRQANHDILNGVTRLSLIGLAGQLGMACEIRPFTVAEAVEAQEAFLTSASTFVIPVIEIDRAPVGTGQPGPIALHLRAAYLEEARRHGR